MTKILKVVAVGGGWAASGLSVLEDGKAKDNFDQYMQRLCQFIIFGV